MNHQVWLQAGLLCVGLVTGVVGATAYLHTRFATKAELRELSKTLGADVSYIRGRVDRLLERLLK